MQEKYCKCFGFEFPEVTVASVSLRYQKAAEVSTAEKKKGVSISLLRNCISINVQI